MQNLIKVKCVLVWDKAFKTLLMTSVLTTAQTKIDLCKGAAVIFD